MTRTTGSLVGYHGAADGATMGSRAVTELSALGLEEERAAAAAERAVDDALAGSFPASDPPSWTSGVARLEAGRSASIGAPLVHEMDVLDLSRPRQHGHRWVPPLRALTGAVGLVLLAPLGILLVGLPVALAVRAALEAIVWVFR